MQLATGDIKTAFLQGYDFDPNMDKQYVGLRPYPGAEVDVWEYDGPIYGDEVAPANLHETFTDFMTCNMKYELMSEEQIKKCADLKLLQYTQCENELSLYYNPKTGHSGKVGG